MAEMSRTFNFDDFDQLVSEALDNYAEVADTIRRPGEIGSVVCQLTLFDENFDPTE